MSGLFYTFNIAKRGMSAQQTSLHIVSHNVSNVNTYGYSKQRAIHSTTQPYPMPSLNSPVGAGQLGTGVEVSEITRARDEFIDSSIRRETSSLFKYSAKDQFLNSIEGIINEPGDTGLSNTLTKFWDAWQGLSTNPENATARKLVLSNSKALTDSFMQTYNQLEELEKELAQLQRDHIYEVNSLLKQISEVNDQIKKVTISGQMPNDLMDRRDILLDKLSENINFKVEHGDHNSIRIITTDSNGSERYLVTDGRVVNGIASIDDVSFTYNGERKDKADFPMTIDVSTISATAPIDMTLKVYIDGDLNRPSEKTIKITSLDDIKKYFNVEVNGDKVRIDSIKNGNLLYNSSTKDIDKAIQEAESFNFTNGAIKGLEDQKLEISDYKNQLNNMARTIAIAVNSIHSDGKENGTEPYINFFDDITGLDSPAKSLKINEAINKDPSKINAGGKMNDPESGDNARAKRIAELRNMRLDIDKIRTKDDFIKQAFGESYVVGTGSNLATDDFIQSNKGDTIDTYYKGMIAQLGTSGQEAKRVVVNQKNLILQLDIQKQSVSGVSMDEEMIDMLQFQRAYQANSKMINVIDELLDLVVNGLIK